MYFRKRKIPISVIFAVAAFVPHAASAQDHPDALAFEVASLKSAAQHGGEFRLFWIAGGRFITNNATLKQLVAFAWDVRGDQISGGPDWLDADQYDIEAKPDALFRVPEGNAATNSFREMLRSLIEDRFKLAVRKEKRELSIYELRVSRGGPRIKAATKSVPQGLFPGRGRVEGKAVRMSQLAAYLAGPAGRVVVDRTGLSDTYDFALTWAPEAQTAVAEVPSVDPGPSIFAALDEQLGLKLERAKGQVDVLIIERAEKPSAN
jgi:uncharacterized protein (TIGR03435 family)